MDLEGRRIIVTGGARGMGASSVRAYVAAGAAVWSLDVLDEEGAAVADRAAGAGPGSVVYRHCDVSDAAEVDAVFDAAVAAMGGLDVLAHAAGIERSTPAEKMAEGDWDLVLAVNARGTFLTNRAACRHMKASGGSIINFGSAAGTNGQPGGAHYAASKGAVLAWTRTVAHEWGRYGIRVNAVAPAIWTEMYDQFRSHLSAPALQAHDAAMAARIPLGGRLGDPDADMAPVMVFLASEGSRFVTGQTLSVDGGLMMVR